MPNPKKIAIVSNLKDKIKKAKSLVFVDYKGLTHQQLEELRKNLKDRGEFEVTKNTLIKIALRPDLVGTQGKPLDLDLAGPTGVLFSYEDEISPLSEMAKFIKKFQLPKIKFGIFGGKIYSETEVIRLSLLPGKEVLLSQVVGGIKTPLNGLVYCLNGNLEKLVVTLEEIRKKRVN